MSDLRVDQISNASGTGAVSFSEGVIISSTSAISNIVINAGVITATSFSGNGVNISGINATSLGKGVAIISVV